MIVVVTGSRTWTHRSVLYQALDEVHAKYGITWLIHGRAAGADGLAEAWSIERGVPNPSIPYPSARGKDGGPIRNGWLLDLAQALVLLTTDTVLVVAFPTPESVGTWNCVTQAKARGLPIRIVRVRDTQETQDHATERSRLG